MTFPTVEHRTFGFRTGITIWFICQDFCFHSKPINTFVHQAVEISGALHVTARLKTSNFQLFLATAED